MRTPLPQCKCEECQEPFNRQTRAQRICTPCRQTSTTTCQCGCGEVIRKYATAKNVPLLRFKWGHNLRAPSEERRARAAKLDWSCTKCGSQDRRMRAKGLCRKCHQAAWNQLTHYDGILKRSYGISREEYNVMLAAQNHVCAICGEAEQAKSNGPNIRALSVDHCHNSGRIRGLLCGSCNSALGFLKDDPDRVRAAFLYVSRGTAYDFDGHA